MYDEKVFNLAIEATDDFALGAFSETTGYPSCVTFFEQRLVFAGTTSQPQTLYFSKSGDYENMDDNYHGTIFIIIVVTQHGEMQELKEHNELSIYVLFSYQNPRF